MMKPVSLVLVIGAAMGVPAMAAETEPQPDTSQQSEPAREAVGDVAPPAAEREPDADPAPQPVTPPARQKAPEASQQAVPPDSGQPAAERESSAAAQPAPLPGSVARAQFTSAVVNREPVDELERLQNNVREVYYFTELRDMEGQRVTHRWEHDGRVMAEVEFDVGGPRWRVWSKKSLVPGWTGRWTVEVVNPRGDTIAEDTFRYADHIGSQSDSVDEGSGRDRARSEPAAQPPTMMDRESGSPAQTPADQEN